MSLLSFLDFRSRNLDQAFRRLRKYDLETADIERLRSLVEHAPEKELFKANPAHLADRLGWDLQHTLDILTLSAKEQLWHLEWDAWCPSCNNLIRSAPHLGELERYQTCPMCSWQGEIHLDSEIAVNASPDEQVRSLNPGRSDNPDFRKSLDERYGRTSALALVNRPLFREVLGEETLPENRSLGVQTLAVFFSDLKSSTAMYQRMGDAEAYQLVREHFKVLFDSVEQYGGSAVKTIGDGVMGTFFNPKDALLGIHSSIQGLQALNQRSGLQGDDQLQLKVGLHVGPCIVVTLNHRLDYFGTTVNLAARLSSLAEGNELLISQAVLVNQEAAQLARKLSALQELTVSVRGISVPVQAYRLRF